jgi:putative alpha-1,2-mannosidase
LRIAVWLRQGKPRYDGPRRRVRYTGYGSEGEVLGFSQTHISGTGGRSKYGNFRMTPFVGEFRLSDLNSPKSVEIASPGYYSVMLDRDGIGVELTATRLCGLHRYTFPSTTEERVLLDATSAIEVDDRAMPTPVSFKQRSV